MCIRDRNDVLHAVGHSEGGSQAEFTWSFEALRDMSAREERCRCRLLGTCVAVSTVRRGMLRELDSGNDGEPKQDSAATLNGTAAKAAGAPAGLGELGVCADAHLIDPDDIGHRTDVPRVFQRRVGQMRPDAYQAAVIGNYPCLLL